MFILTSSPPPPPPLQHVPCVQSFLYQCFQALVPKITVKKGLSLRCFIVADGKCTVHIQMYTKHKFWQDQAFFFTYLINTVALVKVHSKLELHVSGRFFQQPDKLFKICFNQQIYDHRVGRVEAPFQRTGLGRFKPATSWLDGIGGDTPKICTRLIHSAP